MTFRQFLEVGTSTGDIAFFPRIVIPLVRRIWPPEIAFQMEPEEEKKKRKKPHRQPQLDEAETG